MSGENELGIHLGRVRSSSSQRARPFVAPALAAAQKVGASCFAGKERGDACGAAAPLLVVVFLGSPDLRISAAVQLALTFITAPGR
jgi:hypothetical protein